MKERPILMNAFSVQAILEGCKMQTRRVIKPQPQSGLLGDWAYFASTRATYSKDQWMGEKAMRKWMPKYCPHGQIGDRLWVKETWATPGNFDDMKPSELSASHFTHAELAYRATEPHGDAYYKWRPSIFMPRWASRITLEVTAVRVERVQDISHEDALAEGIDPDAPYNNYGTGSIYRDTFAELWDSINQKRGYGWDKNPWVWVVEFSVL